MADLDRFNEAADHFRQRARVTPEQFQKLDMRARRKAFTVSGVAQLDLINDVWQAISKAIEDGEDFNAFRERVGASLTEAWGGENPARLATIFRTNVQLSYGAGRYRQLRDPDTMDARPFWRFSTIMDTRTSDIYSELAGTVLPADDPFWKDHTPPLHFNCRSGIIALTQTQAERAGVTKKVPEIAPGEGFGLAPSNDEWEPDLSAYPAALVKIFRGNGE